MNGGMPGSTSGQLYASAGIEPSVEELLDDPMLHKLLARDHITVEDTRRAIFKARKQLRFRTG